MNKTLKSSLTTGLLMMSMNGATTASTILQPVAASTNMGEYFQSSPGDGGKPFAFSANHVIDQSGLGKKYTSMVDNFENYMASKPSAYHDLGRSSWSSEGIRSGNFDFSLGRSHSVNSFVIWNA
jgi:hypothetical protein